MIHRHDTDLVVFMRPVQVNCVQRYAHSDRSSVVFEDQYRDLIAGAVTHLIPPGGFNPVAFFVEFTFNCMKGNV